VRASLDALVDWGPAGTRPGQYFSDLAADDAGVAILEHAGFGVLSEESGEHHVDRDIVVVIDPVDGSTNASRGIPWFATSLCALDADGALAALVVNQATGQRFGATRGGGAWRDDGGGARGVIHPNATAEIGGAVVLLSGFPPRHLGWKQYRALGAAALDLCAVATGIADAYIDCSRDAHGPWDYLGGMLVCTEAGAVVADAHGRDLVVRGHGDRRTPLAAATPALLSAVVKALPGGEITKKG
jgi:fructose-1,6-bisphosphatase/inositol monophosphatase family enzyme